MSENKQNINDMSNKEFTDHAWSKMLGTLDQEMPVEKKRKRFAFWRWPFAALLVSLGIAVFNYELRNANDELQGAGENTPTEKNLAPLVANDEDKIGQKTTTDIFVNDKSIAATKNLDRMTLTPSENYELGITNDENQNRTIPINSRLPIEKDDKQKPTANNILTERSEAPQKRSVPTPRWLSRAEANTQQRSAPTGEATPKAKRPNNQQLIAKKIATKDSQPEMLDKVKTSDPLPRRLKKQTLKWGLEARLFGSLNHSGLVETGAGLNVSIQKKRWGLHNEASFGILFPNVYSIKKEETLYLEDQECVVNTFATICDVDILPANPYPNQVAFSYPIRTYFIRNSLMGSYTINRHIDLFAGPMLTWKIKTKAASTNDVVFDPLTTPNYQSFLENLDNYETVNKIALGANAGLRFNISKPLSIDLRYQQGITDFRIGLDKRVNYFVQLGFIWKIK